MWGFENIVYEIAEILYIDTTTASLIITAVILLPIIVAVYFATYGTVHGSKTWMFVAWTVGAFVLTYLGICVLWLGIVFTCLPLAFYIAYQISKVARGAEA